MRWLREHGLIATYDDYLSLPIAVLDDARLVMGAEWEREAAEAEKQNRETRRGGRGNALRR